jgi:hypothetical protein
MSMQMPEPYADADARAIRIKTTQVHKHPFTLAQTAERDPYPTSQAQGFILIGEQQSEVCGYTRGYYQAVQEE